VDDARDKTQDRQNNIDPKVGRHTHLHESGDWRKNERKDDLYDLHVNLLLLFDETPCGTAP